MFLRISDNKLLKKYKTILPKIEDLKSINQILYQFWIYDGDRNIKAKIRTYGDNV